MTKFTYLFDPGHGGLIGGKYVTPGKRSPKFDNGSVLYEGVNNREIVNLLIAECGRQGISCQDIVSSNDDVSLLTRVTRANTANHLKPCVYISIHSDANGNGLVWDKASGMSVYTSKGETASDPLATLIINQLKTNFSSSVKWRTDMTDLDPDKEENFYVLKFTDCPAVLCELGFHTNKEEATAMLTPVYKQKIVTSIINAIKEFEAAHK